MSDTTESVSEMNQHSQPKSDVLRKTLKAPNRRKFEEEIELLNTAILAKEADFSKLKQGNHDNSASRPDKIPSIRAEKNNHIGKRKQIDQDLRCLNQEISKKMGELTKVQSNLPYKKEEKINDAIRKLEQQLTMTNFRLSEEKKIVAEIDTLKRSKKALEQYMAVKKEIDGMRDSQRSMREERDYYFKSVTNLKQKEDELKKASQNDRSNAAALRKEIEALYEEKRRLLADFKSQEKTYQVARDEIRRQQRLNDRAKKENVKVHSPNTYQQQGGVYQYQAWTEPYDEEKHLCNTLIAYLQPYLAGSDVSPTTCSHQQSDSLEAAKELETEGMYLLRKKSDDNLFDGVSRVKANRRNKRDRRKPANKPLTHTPEIFAHFAQLELKAPSSVVEISSSILQLEEKKLQLELLNNDSICQDLSDNTDVPSCTESGIPSMPSTPEVLLDSCPPQFETSRRRRLSGDSGLDDQSSCDELLTDEKPPCICDRLPSATSSSTDIVCACSESHYPQAQLAGVAMPTGCGFSSGVMSTDCRSKSGPLVNCKQPGLLNITPNDDCDVLNIETVKSS